MPTTTPRRIRGIAFRILVFAFPLTIVTLLAWGLDWVPEEGRAEVFMLYQLFLCFTLASGIVAALAHGQLGVARAFTVGYNTAIRQMREAETEASSHGEHYLPVPPPLR